MASSRSAITAPNSLCPCSGVAPSENPRAAVSAHAARSSGRQTRTSISSVSAALSAGRRPSPSSEHQQVLEVAGLPATLSQQAQQRAIGQGAHAEGCRRPALVIERLQALQGGFVHGAVHAQADGDVHRGALPQPEGDSIGHSHAFGRRPRQCGTRHLAQANELRAYESLQPPSETAVGVHHAATPFLSVRFREARRESRIYTVIYVREDKRTRFVSGSAPDLAGVGLSSAEVEARVAAGQVNAAPRPGGRTTWDIVRTNVFTYFNLILSVLFVAMVTFGSWKDALFGIIVVVNTVIGIVQEMRAKVALDRLTDPHGSGGQGRARRRDERDTHGVRGLG